ncbi:MAG: sigma-54 dependent transcriptional regulator [Fibrobacter sp.]|nr:sigma-54 dependent transcriptional regulator [Fibrobacter sp.]
MIIKENMLKIAANSDISVLLQGESGCGKEVAARYIHGRSARSRGPFVAVNCGAIASNLAESILEGARKGAYTGANSEQVGVVRASSGGTLFLDEIGEMPMEQQCKLLRILQERSVMPLGATTNIPVDFRLICATNRNLRDEVAAGRFREDLYFRLNVFPIKLPALRDRSDFENIAQELWAEANMSPSNPLPGYRALPLSPAELYKLKIQRWPGNVRQLKNVLQRYALLKPYSASLQEILDEEFASPDSATARSAALESAALPRLYDPTRQYIPTRQNNTAPHREIILAELHKNNWNKSATALKLGISRGSLAYQIRKHGLELQTQGDVMVTSL